MPRGQNVGFERGTNDDWIFGFPTDEESSIDPFSKVRAERIQLLPRAIPRLQGA